MRSDEFRSDLEPPPHHQQYLPLDSNTHGSHHAEKITAIFLDNRRRCLAREPLVNVVDKGEGY